MKYFNPCFFFNLSYGYLVMAFTDIDKYFNI